VGAVKEGRTIYDNIVKFVRFQLSHQHRRHPHVLGAPLLGLPTPFTAIQILWVNIIMDGPAGHRPLASSPRGPASWRNSRVRPMRASLTGRAWDACAVRADHGGGHPGPPTPGARAAAAVTPTRSLWPFTTFVLFQFLQHFQCARPSNDSAFGRQFSDKRPAMA